MPLHGWSLSFCNVVLILGVGWGLPTIRWVPSISAVFHTVVSFFGIIHVRESHCNNDYFFMTPVDTSLFISAALCTRFIGYGLPWYGLPLFSFSIEMGGRFQSLDVPSRATHIWGAMRAASLDVMGLGEDNNCPSFWLVHLLFVIFSAQYLKPPVDGVEF